MQIHGMSRTPDAVPQRLPISHDDEKWRHTSAWQFQQIVMQL